jgi:hypothetical protein
MNGNYQTQKDIYGSRNQMRDQDDYFDVSIEGNDQRNNSTKNQQKRPPTLQSYQGNQTIPTVGVTSPAGSNIPTHGDVMSPKEEEYPQQQYQHQYQPQQHHNNYNDYMHSDGNNYNMEVQAPNQAQNRNNRNTENETEIFSFRREGQQNQGREQEHADPWRDRGSHRDLDISPLSEREYYDKTKLWFIKLKKFYVYFVLNIACLGLIIFNLSVAYSTENINFERIQTIDQQFQEKVVLDIDLMAKTQNCNEPYVLSRMGTWPGYDKICQCPTVTYPGECQGTDILAGCHSLQGFNPVEIHNWDEKKLCLRKSDKSILEYYESSDFIESYNGNFLCPNGLKKCIVSSNKNFICVGRFEFCPVTQIEVTTDNDNPDNKYKAQLKFSDKILIYDNQGAIATTFTDIIVDHQNCDVNLHTTRAQIDQQYCQKAVNKTLLDKMNEIPLVLDNSNQNLYSSIQNDNVTMGLYALKMNYLDMCMFNNTFNPVILNSQLSNWRGVKTLLFINPFFLSTLFMVNMLRVIMTRYINKNTAAEGPSSKRKKEIYHIFGRSFAGSSIIVITQVSTILYYIFWGYLLLNPDRLIAEKWLEMSCIPADVKTEIQYMISQFSRIETFNMVTIGPMILGCIAEALFSQYKLITTSYTQLRRDPL